MIIVDAAPADVSPLLKHADWAGLTAADLAFPAFVFAMGASAALKKPPLLKIFRRAGILFLIGLMFNAFPEILSGTFSWERLRIFGILQRLAPAYLFGMLIVRKFESGAGILTAAFVLLLISSAGFHLYAPAAPFDETRNLSGAVDLIFGANHLYTPTHDPEGLYGAAATTASMLIGFMAGRILIGGERKFLLLIIFGAALLILGEMWACFDIVAKKLWTAPFALITSGISAAFLALLLMLPVAQKFFRPIVALGKNPLLLFLASNFALVFLFSFQIGVNCWLWCALWMAAAMILERRGVLIKI